MYILPLILYNFSLRVTISIPGHVDTLINVSPGAVEQEIEINSSNKLIM